MPYILNYAQHTLQGNITKYSQFSDQLLHILTAGKHACVGLHNKILHVIKMCSLCVHVACA